MFKGTILLQSKQPTWAAMNVFYAHITSILFVFDDALAIDRAARTGDILSAVSQYFIGHGSGIIASGVIRAQKSHTKEKAAQFPANLTVEQLREHFPHARVVPIDTVASLRLTTALRPVTQLGGADLTFKFSREADPIFRYYKQHIVSDVPSAVRLLQDILTDKVRDDRFSWAKK